MDPVKIAEKLRDHRSLSDTELDELLRSLSSERTRQLFGEEIVRLWNEFQDEEASGPDLSGLLQKIRTHQESDRRIRRQKTLRLAAAAVVAAVTLGAVFVINHVREGNDLTAEYVRDFGSDNRAVLTTSAGKTIAMDTLKEEFLREDGSVMSVSTGGIAYDDASEGGDDAWHSISVPRSGEYQITLHDGTRIWLNSDSRLDYPVRFSPDDRRVFLTGEAYFEVVPDGGRPFTVETEGQRITVLGTGFNVSAYGNDPRILTTLVEGSVRIETAGGQRMVLVPGNQAGLDRDSGMLDVRDVDVDEITAWKQGLIVIEEQTLDQVLRTLSRWYDVEFHVERGIPGDMVFKGSIPKYQELEKTLRRLEMISDLKMKIYGNTVRISK